MVSEADQIIMSTIEGFLSNVELMLPDVGGDLQAATCFAHLDMMNQIMSSMRSIEGKATDEEHNNAYAKLGFLADILTGFAHKMAIDTCCVKTIEDARELYANAVAGIETGLAEDLEELLKNGNH